MASLPSYMVVYRERISRMFEVIFSQEDSVCNALVESMQYSMKNGGKCIRPALVYATHEAVSGSEMLEQADIPACAVELIHVYSLIHDDLPVMDNDDLRRGQLTNHKVYGEAIALLAGDSLQTLAFEVLSDAKLLFDYGRDLSDKTRLALIKRLSRAIGFRGMVAGQAIDIGATGQISDSITLEEMHQHKTGALICASVHMGALVGGLTDQYQLSKLDVYAKNIGIAFQVCDDILDVTGKTKELGKRQGADLKSGKPSYVSIHGLDKARAMMHDLHKSALDSLCGFNSNADRLRGIADLIVSRTY